MSPLTKRHKQWRVNIFAVTWISYAGYYFCRKTFSIVKKDLKDILELETDGEIAIIGTALLAAYMLGQFITAFLGKRISCRRILLGGMGLSVLANVAMGAFVGAGPAGYWPIFTLMIVNGLAQGTGWGANVGVLAHWFRRKERGTVMALWATCYMLGSVLAKSFAAFMLGWQGVAWGFWGAAIVLGVVWVIFFFMVRDRPEDYGMEVIVPDSLDVVETVDKRGRRSVSSLGWTWDVKRTVLMMGVAYFCFKFVRYALDSWTPMLIQEAFGSSGEVAGYQSTVFDLLGGAGVIFAGVLTDKFFRGSRIAVTVGMTLGMLAGVVFLWQVGPNSAFLFVVGLGMIGFMLAGPDSLLSGVGTVDVGSKRGAVVAAAIVNGVGSIGPIVQELLIGAIKDGASTQSEGMNAVLLLLVGVSIAGVITTTVLLMWRRGGRSDL